MRQYFKYIIPYSLLIALGAAIVAVAARLDYNSIEKFYWASVYSFSYSDDFFIFVRHTIVIYGAFFFWKWLVAIIKPGIFSDNQRPRKKIINNPVYSVMVQFSSFILYGMLIYFLKQLKGLLYTLYYRITLYEILTEYSKFISIFFLYATFWWWGWIMRQIQYEVFPEGVYIMITKIRAFALFLSIYFVISWIVRYMSLFIFHTYGCNGTIDMCLLK